MHDLTIEPVKYGLCDILRSAITSGIQPSCWALRSAVEESVSWTYDRSVGFVFDLVDYDWAMLVYGACPLCRI